MGWAASFLIKQATKTLRRYLDAKRHGILTEPGTNWRYGVRFLNKADAAKAGYGLGRKDPDIGREAYIRRSGLPTPNEERTVEMMHQKVRRDPTAAEGASILTPTEQLASTEFGVYTPQLGAVPRGRVGGPDRVGITAILPPEKGQLLDRLGRLQFNLMTRKAIMEDVRQRATGQAAGPNKVRVIFDREGSSPGKPSWRPADIQRLAATEQRLARLNERISKELEDVNLRPFGKRFGHTHPAGGGQGYENPLRAALMSGMGQKGTARRQLPETDPRKLIEQARQGVNPETADVGTIAYQPGRTTGWVIHTPSGIQSAAKFTTGTKPVFAGGPEGLEVVQPTVGEMLPPRLRKLFYRQGKAYEPPVHPILQELKPMIDAHRRLMFPDVPTQKALPYAGE